MQTSESARNERRVHADRLNEAQTGWLSVAVRESRRLERRERWQRLLVARGLKVETAAGTS